MNIAETVRNVRRSVKTVDGQFAELFRLPDESLAQYEGRLGEVALAHAVIRLRKEDCICVACGSDAFGPLRKAVLDAAASLKTMEHEGGDDEEDETGDAGDAGDTGDKRG